jgi:anti-sigma factor RsiW
MKCEEIAELLPDYLQGRLVLDQAGLVEEHLRNCVPCGEEAALWQKLVLLPDEQPGPSVRSRFKAMLDSYQEGRWEKTSLFQERGKGPALWGLGNWLQAPAAGVMWACIFLLCGFLIGRNSDRTVPGTDNDQLRAMHEELTNMRQLVALSMLKQQSASQRLEGVSWSTRMPELDPKVLDALLHTLRYDNSVDVRLASLDALSRYGSRPEVRRGLIEALPGQQSPLVQVALIDLLVDLHDSEAVQQLKRFQQDPKVDPTVRKRADWGIQQLS